MGYLNKQINPLNIPQSEPLNERQAKNNAGGFVYQVDKWQRLRRFLILGTEGGTFYVTQGNLTYENVQALKDCLAEPENNARRVIDEILDVSTNGRAHKNDHALFALALASLSTHMSVRSLAYSALPQVARIGTDLFQFIDFRKSLGGGWGRGIRTAVKNWYMEKDIESLAYQVSKYQQRVGWSHCDLLKLAHPKPERYSDRDAVFRWVLRKHNNVEQLPEKLPDYLQAVDKINMEGIQIPDAARIIADNKLPREVVPTNFLKDKKIWRAMLGHMPMTAMVRNLGVMSQLDLLSPLSDEAALVCSKLTHAEKIRKSKIHPIHILAAMTTYAQGHGMRGSGKWPVTPSIISALDTAFELSFENVEPTNKKILIGLDVSGSMSACLVAQIPGLTCRIAAAVLSLITARTEPAWNTHVVAFSHKLVPIDFTQKMIENFSVNNLIEKTDRLPFGNTDCALPMLYAIENKLNVNAFLIYTDNETWYGRTHPAEALKKYREFSGNKNAKLVIVSMASNKFSIADPNDPHMIDIVGFDTGTPQLISNFIRE